MPSHWYWKKRKEKQILRSTGGLVVPTAYATRSVTITIRPEDLDQPGPLQDRGLAIEPIVGVREYHVFMTAEELPALLSYNGVSWPHRKPLNAMCGDNPFADHDAPKENCGCGIYAWKPEFSRNGQGQLWGEVYLWGDVLICDAGYRAEIAYPKTLHIRAPQTRASMRLRDGLEAAYGVTVTLDDPEAKDEDTFDVTTFGTIGTTGPVGPFGQTGAISTGPIIPIVYNVPSYTIPPPTGAQGQSPTG